MSPPQTPYSALQLMRYPVIVGGFVACAIVGFIYRESFIVGDLTERKKKLFSHEDMNYKKYLEEQIKLANPGKYV